MPAFLFCVVLFAFWGAIGYALFALTPARIGPRRRVLLSPALGAAVIIVPVFWLNHAGLAVESFATPLLATIGVLAAAVLAWKRPALAWRRMLPFAVALLVALALAAWPMFLYGFDWVSFGNSDMTHYSLGAARVLHGGFFDPPDLDAVVRGTDYAVYDAYKYISFDARSGSELMLAAIWALTGLDAHLIFMPVTMALHLTLICAAAAMVAGPRWPPKASLIVALLLAVSPLTTLGALYQLVAQVGGLAFLCASVALLYRIPAKRPLVPTLTGAIPTVLAMAALFIWYPEILPFLGLGWFVFLAMVAWRNRQLAWRVFGHAARAGLLLLALLNVYFVGALKFMFSQAQTGGVSTNVLHTTDLTVSAFPYFLVPSGVPIFWGIIPLTGLDTSDYLTAAVAFAFALSIWFLLGLYRSIRRASPAAAVYVVMGLLALLLFMGKKDFGLFKLAMFVQPFMLALVGERLASSGPGLKSRGMAFAMVGAASFIALFSQLAYVRISTGEHLRGLSEIWHGSASRINTMFPRVVATLKEKSPAGFTSDTGNVVQIQHQTLYSRGYSALYPAAGALGLDEAPKYPQIADKLRQTRAISLAGKKTSFVLAWNLKEELARRWLVTIPRYETIFNLAHSRGHSQDYYRILSPDEVVNHLIFMPSKMGDHYYGAGARIAFNHLENDPIFPGRLMSGLGRDFLFLLMNPSSNPRVVMEITSTVMRQFDSRLPNPTVHGASRHTVAFVGRGSGRVVSPPIEPTYLEGVPFIAIDIGRAPRLTPYEAKGVMRLFGKDINPDLRYLTAYAREISVISNAQYAAFAPPSELRKFPQDLGNPDLEFSGIYEDGWISEESFFVLGANPSADKFRVSGTVPAVADSTFTTTIDVRIDGEPAASRELKLGEFALDIPLPKSTARKRRVEIRFSKAQQLPGGDGRMTPALISFLGLVAGP